MPNPLAITAGTSVLGLGMAHSASNQASRDARRSADATKYAADKEFEIAQQGLDLQKKAFKFEQDKYAKWEKTYGNMESNLAKMYTKLSPSKYAAMGIENFEKDYEFKMTSLRETLAQRGISADSGVALAVEQQAELGAAEARAGIRTGAEDKVLAMQTDFLQVGLGREPNMSQAYNNLASGYTGLQNAAGSQTANARANQTTAENRANAAEASTGKAIQTAVSELGTGLSTYLESREKPETKPGVLV